MLQVALCMEKDGQVLPKVDGHARVTKVFYTVSKY